MEKQKYGLQTSGKIRVFVNTKEHQNEKKKAYTITDYLFTVSENDQDGKYINKYMKMIFKRDSEKPVNKQVINVKEAYFLLTGTGDFRQIGLFVKDWEPADE